VLGLQALNIALFAFHTLLVFFNLLGWAWKKTRRWNLATLTATAFSWFVMGLWKGLGYCICTDWHWHIRRELGYHDTAKTYIQLLFDSIGIHLAERPVATITAIGFIVASVASLALNVRDWRRTRHQEASVLPS
jgi:hypothetical protein